MKMKKNIAILATIATMIFSGCGDDRSHPKDLNISGNSVKYGDPIAIIDLNATNHKYLKDDNGTLVYRFSNMSDKFIFNGNNSHDTDERNQKIISYDWNITSSFTNGCLDINKTGTYAYINICEEAYNDGSLNVVLTVTDDENKTATATKKIKIN
jgi:hypothetical protein